MTRLLLGPTPRPLREHYLPRAIGSFHTVDCGTFPPLLTQSRNDRPHLRAFVPSPIPEECPFHRHCSFSASLRPPATSHNWPVWRSVPAKTPGPAPGAPASA
jgi:hypothetical protein